MGEQLLNHLYYREETAFVIEGSSLRSAKATREAYACARLGTCLHLTILRHPVDRVISDTGSRVLGAVRNAITVPVDGVSRDIGSTGRWGLFKKPLKDEEISFGDWLRQKRQIHAGHRNERLWSVTSKTLAGAVQCINQIVAARRPDQLTGCRGQASPIIVRPLGNGQGVARGMNQIARPASSRSG